MKINQSLLNFQLFESLSNPEVSRIMNQSSEKNFSKNSMIFEFGAEFNSVYIIVSGSVR